MKSWTEKLNSPRPHQVKPAPRDMAGMKAGQIMLIPTAHMIDDFIRKLPEGQSKHPRRLRAELADQFRAEITCPITTGIFLRIVAEAAWESYQSGTPLSEVTPVWRVISPDTPTFSKLSFDNQFILDQRESEGLDKEVSQESSSSTRSP